MKGKIKIIIVAIVSIGLIGIALCMLNSKDTKNVNVGKKEDKTEIENAKDYINISQCSDEFMDNYFEEVKKISKSENKEDILIVTSKKKLEDTYGATCIVAGPNNQYFLQYENSETKLKALEELKKDSSNIVEENTTRKITDETVLVSNYNSWGVEAMGIDKLLDQMKNRNDLNNVVVAVIDTGLDVELFNQNFPGRMIKGYNVINPEESITDKVGHGTHIAGTIAECTPDNVWIMPIKASENKIFYSSDIIAAIYYAMYASADTINMSFGGLSYINGEHVAIESAKQKDIISVAAAGNDNNNIKNYPAAFEDTISISAVDSNKNKAEFSNYGNSIMFATPGTEIVSINGAMSGTSMATPHAVSSVALLKCLNNKLSFDDILTLLKRYSQDLGDSGWDEYFGFGFINFSDAEVRNDNNSDEYNVFKKGKNDQENLTVESYNIIPRISNYNYGTINNILKSEVIINYKNGISNTYTLDEVTHLEISNYNPTSSEKQKVNIKLTTPLGYEIDDYAEFENPPAFDFETVWQYNIINKKNIEITGTKDTYSIFNKLYFPSEIDGYTAVSIADKEKSIFSDSQLRNLNEVYLPSTITRVGSYAFSIKNGSASHVTYVKSDADSLEVGEGAFENAYLRELSAKISYVGDRAFSHAENLYNITFSDNLTYIGSGAFYDSLKNAKIVIPKSTTMEINAAAFQHSRIKEIIFDNSMKRIEDNMFEDCHYLEKVVCSNDLEEIGCEAFYKCSELSELYFSKCVTEIDDTAFWGTGNRFIAYVYNNTYPKTYMSDKKIKYKTVDPTNINVEVAKNQYKAYEKVNPTNDITSIKLYYGEGKWENNVFTETTKTNEEIINDNFTIEYYTQAESFREGDKYYTIKGTNQYGEEFQTQVNVTVEEVIKPTIIPKITVKAKVYDGTTKIDKNNVIISNLDNTEYSVISAVSSSAEIGTQVATIKIRLTDKKFSECTFENGKQEKEFSVDFKIIDANGIIGDVNADGKINVIDCTAILKHIKGTKLLTEEEQLRADVNKDNKVNVIDCTAILKHIKGTKLIEE